MIVNEQHREDLITIAKKMIRERHSIPLDKNGPLDENGNPVTLYNIYFGLLKDGFYEYYGLTVPIDDIPSIPGINYTSYMEVHKDFAGFPSEGLSGLKVTAAHEFHHAIQFCYNVRNGDKFFWEMTSTWIEDFIYPEINDYYQYLPYFFSSVSNTRFDIFNFSSNGFLSCVSNFAIDPFEKGMP